MASRNELVIRGNAVGLTAASYPNDSKFEQKILWLEKNATAQTGTISTTTLTSDGTATATAGTIVLGDMTYTTRTALTEAKATSTYTNASKAVAGETVTIDGFTYTYKATISATDEDPYSVLIGDNATASLANLALAIDAGATAGTNYGIGTKAHPRVSSVSSDATTLVVTADVIGTIGNTYLTSENAAGSWTGTALAGGKDAIPNEVLIGSTSSGAAFLDNFLAAINNGAGEGTKYSTGTPKNPLCEAASTNSATEQVITSRNFSILNGAIATTNTASHLSFTSTVMGSGVSKVITPATTTYGGGPGVSGDKNLIV